MIVHTILVFAELCMDYRQSLLLHQAEWDNLHMQLVSSRYLPFGLLSCFVALQRPCHTTMSSFRPAIMPCSTSAAMWNDITCCTQHWRLPIPCFLRYTSYPLRCNRRFASKDYAAIYPSGILQAGDELHWQPEIWKLANSYTIRTRRWLDRSPYIPNTNFGL
jgi:hypothetical protein